MQRHIPSQCPECGDVSVAVVSVPPSRHDRGGDWLTRAECERCESYVEWFD